MSPGQGQWFTSAAVEITAVLIPEGPGPEFRSAGPHTRLSHRLFAAPQSGSRRSRAQSPPCWAVGAAHEAGAVLLQEAQRGEAVRVRPLRAALCSGQHADVPRAAAHRREALRL